MPVTDILHTTSELKAMSLSPMQTSDYGIIGGYAGVNGMQHAEFVKVINAAYKRNAEINEYVALQHKANRYRYKNVEALEKDEDEAKKNAYEDFDEFLSDRGQAKRFKLELSEYKDALDKDLDPTEYKKYKASGLDPDEFKTKEKLARQKVFEANAKKAFGNKPLPSNLQSLVAPGLMGPKPTGPGATAGSTGPGLPIKDPNLQGTSGLAFADSPKLDYATEKYRSVLDPKFFENMFKLEGIPTVPETKLPAIPLSELTPAKGFNEEFWGFLNNIQDATRQAWKEAETEPPALTQLAVQDIPKPEAKQVPDLSALSKLVSGATLAPSAVAGMQERLGDLQGLNFLQSGQGYTPDALARMRAMALEDISGAGIQEMSQAKRALQQSGLSASPAGVSIQEGIARNVGREQSRALSGIEVQNAMQALENMRMGAPMEMTQALAMNEPQMQSELQRLGSVRQAAPLQQETGMSNMQQANAMALQNAANILNTMQQNVQTTNVGQQMQFGTEAGRKRESSEKISSALARGQEQYGGLQTGMFLGAQQSNVANQISQALNQAQLQRQADILNQQTKEGRWRTGVGALTGLITGSNPLGFYKEGGQVEMPNFQPAQSLANLGQAFVNAGIFGGGRKA